jgi:RNA polymerase sigma factor (sigma-70 family)
MAPKPQSESSERGSRTRTLDTLLRAERGQLMRQARFHSRRPEDAEEALSEACVEFLRFYDGPPGEDAVRWMLLVVKRCAWAITRRTEMRSARHGVIDIAALGDEELQVAALERQLDVPDLAARSEETDRLIELIEQLKPDEREALILLGLGCSYAEIGEMRGWSRTKVRRCIYEGRARVREALERGGN